MNRINKTFVSVALVLLMIVSVPAALSYFTTFTQAKGKKTIHLEDKSQISNETVGNEYKQLTISADEGSSPIFVRVKAFHIEGIKTSLSEDAINTGWSYNDDDQYYYYANPLDGDSKTTDIEQTTTIKLNVKLPDAVKEGDEIHVVLVYEAVAAEYDNTSGKWIADWTNTKIGGNQ